jgi:two-component system OmpR family sensor kinase
LNSLAPLRLDRRSPVELEPLVNALNDLLNRLDIASRAQRTFVADAAHELRSPLAALKLQIQAAERDGSLTSSGTFERIKGRLDRMIHLVHQLLILAREDAPRADQFEVVSLRGTRGACRRGRFVSCRSEEDRSGPGLRRPFDG